MSKTLLLDQYMENLDSGMLEGLMPAELELTEAEIGRVKSLALKRVRQPKRARAGKRRVAVLIAAVVGMMAAAAAGAANLAGEELFGRYFGGGLQPGWLEKMCSTSQASARADGYQVDLLGVMGSRYGVNLIFDLTETFTQKYDDYVLWNGDLVPIPLEEFLRKAQPGVQYCIGAVLTYKH